MYLVDLLFHTFKFSLKMFPDIANQKCFEKYLLWKTSKYFLKIELATLLKKDLVKSVFLKTHQHIFQISYLFEFLCFPILIVSCVKQMQ